jgi:hypothetical protein
LLLWYFGWLVRANQESEVLMADDIRYHVIIRSWRVSHTMVCAEGEGDNFTGNGCQTELKGTREQVQRRKIEREEGGLQLVRL